MANQELGPEISHTKTHILIHLRLQNDVGPIVDLYNLYNFRSFQDIPIKTGCKKSQHFIISIRKHPGIYKLPNYFSDQSHEK